VTPNGNDIQFSQFGGFTSTQDDGADLLQGGAGNDYLSGGQGGDFMDGGADDDELIGDSGATR